MRLHQRWIATLVTASGVLLACAPILHAEEPAPALRLHLSIARRPPPAHPSPDPAVAEADARQAIAEVEARERDAKAMREAVPRAPLRPDLGYDVVSGIQASRLGDALRRR